MSQSPVIVNNNVVVPGTAVVTPEAPKSEAPKPVDQSAKFSLNIIAIVFLVLSFVCLDIAVNGTDDRDYWGLLKVLHYVYHYRPRAERDMLLMVSFAIPFLSAAFFVCLAVAVTQKKGPCCVISLVILLMGLYCAFVPNAFLWNPAAALLDGLDWQQDGHLVTAWRYFAYSGVSVGISLKIWIP